VEELQERGVTHVLDLADQSYAKHAERFKYLSISIADNENADLAQHFPATNAFIDEAIVRGGAVLVHCDACVSRSPSVVIAYLLRTKQMDVNAALATVRSVRSRAKPNEGFMRQLHIYLAGLSNLS
jgi:protein-tyrosine phosphatase